MCRQLKAEEIECRVAQVSAKGCSLLLYKTARVDRAILTETYGNRWQNDFKVVDGKMYGGIGVFDTELKQWLWRWDCGVESNTEKEKGEASDCFKRAGFKWGIGVELYTAPFIWANVETEQVDGKWKLKEKFAKFDVKEIGYAENGNINKLIITDNKGNTVYELGKFTKQPEQEQHQAKKKEQANADIDIFAGLTACSDMNSLRIYFNEYKTKVVDVKGFTELKDKLKATMIK